MGTEDFQAGRSRLLPVSLVISTFASGLILVLVSLLLVDVASDFSNSVAVTGQLNTVFSIAAKNNSQVSVTFTKTLTSG